MPRPFADAPEYRALLLGLLMVLGVLLWPVEGSEDAEAPRTATSVQVEDEAPGTWPAAQSPEAAPESAPAREARVGED